MKRIAPILMCVLALMCTASALADAVEGTKWKINVVPSHGTDASAKEFQDTLTFKGSMFTSEELAKHGFKPIAYDDNTTRFGPATFTADPTSETDGKAHWAGTITATVINGTLVWTTKDGKVREYEYKGEKLDK